MFDVAGDPFIAPDGSVVPLSPAVIANGFVFVSGQIALQDGAIVGSDIRAQTRFILDRIDRILDQAGTSMAHVVKTMIWITRAEDFAGFNEIYAQRFHRPWPARATVVIDLTLPEALIEVEAIATLA